MHKSIALLCLGGMLGIILGLIIVGIARGADPHPYCPGWPAGIEPQAGASSITFDPVTGEYSEPVVTCLQLIRVPVAADGQ